MPIVSNIAVVDDEAEVRDILSKLVTSLGHKPVPIPSGKELLDRVGKNETFDLVLMDVVMPGLNGLATLKEMRQPKSKHRLTPVFMVTGYHDDRIVEASKQLHADGFILKPFDQKALGDAIAKTLPKGAPVAEFRRILAKAMMPDSTHFQRTPLQVLDKEWAGFPVVDGKTQYGVFVNKMQTVAQVAKANELELAKNVRIYKQEEGSTKWVELRLESEEKSTIEILDMLIENI